MGEGGWVGMIEEKGMRRKRRGIKTEGGRREKEAEVLLEHRRGEGRQDTEFTFLLGYLRRRRRIDW